MRRRVCEEEILVRPFMTNLFEQLVARHADSKRIDLDDIAEVIGTRVVSYDEVEWLVDHLEAEGFSVGEGIEALDVNVMKDVLAHVRALREALERRPTIDEIAQASGRPVYVVRRALERAAGKHTKVE